jgi:DNA-binding MarR family transcriptional regulator
MRQRSVEGASDVDVDVEVQAAVRGFLVASRALVAVAARSLADEPDITLPQFRALVVLSVQPGVPVSELAAALDIHPTTATRLTDRLVRKRLVRRTESRADRRVTELRLTPSGARLVQRVTGRRLRELTAIVERMPAGRWPEVNEALEAFAAATGEPPPVDVFGWDLPTRPSEDAP